MAAIVETGALITEFSGKNKIFTCKCTAQVGSAGTLTVEEATTIHSVQATQYGLSTVDCTHTTVFSVASNIITFAGVEADGTINTQNPVDFYATVIYS